MNIEQNNHLILFAKNMAKAANLWQEIIADTIANPKNKTINDKEIINISEAFMEAIGNIASDPVKLMNISYDLWQNYAQLWHESSLKFLGIEEENNIIKDRRFRNEAWEENIIFDFIRQSYLISSTWLKNNMSDIEGLDKKTANKVSFYTRQFVDAMSPSNFAITNPEILKKTIDSNGENLVSGLENIKKDIEAGIISMSKDDSFTIGKNIATTAGKVVFQNKMMQLIQYEASTNKVNKTPILIIPAWINKFYILDMRPENSFVKWLTDQGHSVFIISWVNPNSEYRNTGFEEYMQDGIIAALNEIENITGENSTSAIGYCLGGTLLAITLAYLQKKGQAKRVKSTTYLTTMIDFSEAGELAIFVDEDQIQALEKKMSINGYLDGKDMISMFSMLRANDLIWSFVINNYLLGKDPFPFDLLYWNTDSTRMPEKMHSFYMRNMYLYNNLAKAKGIKIDDVDIDLTTIKTPSYILSCREDHIAPWESTYKSTQIYTGDVKFVLSASGHIAGVVNPPSKTKYCFWENGDNNFSKTSDEWLKNTTKTEGSWWINWNEWQEKYSGEKIPARKIGKSIEDAPGSYVLVR